MILMGLYFSLSACGRIGYSPIGNDNSFDGGGGDALGADSGLADTGTGMDAGIVDAGSVDSGPMDAGPVDSGPMDAGLGLWSKRIGAASDDRARAVLVDPLDQVYVAGIYTAGPINLGGANLMGSTGREIFVGSFQPDGTHRWSVTSQNSWLTSAARWQSLELAHNGTDRIYAALDSRRYLAIGSLAQAVIGDYDAIVIEIDAANGTPLRMSRYGAVGETVAVRDITADALGTYLLGDTTGSVDFGSGLVSIPGQSGFLAAFEPNGTDRWVRTFDSLLDAGPLAADLSADGRTVYVAGKFNAPMDFGAGSVSPFDTWDLFVAAYQTTDGALQWLQHFGASRNFHPRSIVVDNSDRITVGGVFDGDADFQDGNGVVSTGPTSTDMFLLALDGSSMGAVRWALPIDSTGQPETVTSLAVDGAGNVYAAARDFLQFDFGGGLVQSTDTFNTGVAFSVTPTGQHRWSFALDTPVSGEEANAIAVDSSGATYLTGIFEGSWPAQSLNSAGGPDVFVRKF